ncbi:MAG: acyl-CoA synthetase [Actinomycetota bacterium]|nr:acyl-CoA synthetase [Actinomycetota bacterium]
MQLETLTAKALTARTLIECGMFAPARPDRLVLALKAISDWGPTTAGGYTASAVRYPDAVSIIDDAGSLTFGEVHRRTNALAHAWSDEGIVEDDSVALLCRNHRGFVEAMVACSKLGADALFLNTAFSGPQLAEVCEREQPRAIVYDEEFDDLVARAAPDSRRFVAWSDGGSPRAGAELLETLIERGDPSDVVVPATKGRIVILTSGTTGTPKGANRKLPETLDPIAALIEKIPLRARERTLIAAPLFHSWGLAHLILGIALSSTLILQRRFDPQDALSAIDEHGATALIAVPVMLQRMLELGPRTLGRYDTGSLRVIAASGAALPGELATKVMDAFGDILYNLYGSTEVAWATVATPEDLRAAPGTAGRPPRGTVVRLYDADDREVGRGETGRIFVGNELCFDGYSDGGNKALVDGLMSSGDVGHFDEGGRLFVDGRDDEMIVSGGENVFPREVEDAIATLDGVEEVAAVGVQDAQFGQRLRAFVVVGDAATVSEQDVKAHVRANLARFKVPREVVFVDELPRNATGKVLKRELVEDAGATPAQR